MASEAVLLCHGDVRRALEDLLSSAPSVLPIVAYSEVPASIRVIVMGRVEPGGEDAAPVVDSSAVPWQMRTRL
jgi:flagellar biosynthesis component FlhA